MDKVELLKRKLAKVYEDLRQQVEEFNQVAERFPEGWMEKHSCESKESIFAYHVMMANINTAYSWLLYNGEPVDALESDDAIKFRDWFLFDSFNDKKVKENTVTAFELKLEIMRSWWLSCQLATKDLKSDYEKYLQSK